MIDVADVVRGEIVRQIKRGELIGENFIVRGSSRSFQLIFVAWNLASCANYSAKKCSRKDAKSRQDANRSRGWDGARNSVDQRLGPIRLRIFVNDLRSEPLSASPPDVHHQVAQSGPGRFECNAP